MPKIYEQQISWQPTGTQRVQAAQIQDFISPALENLSQVAQNSMELMRDIGDRKAASEMDAAAQAADTDIKNWTDFSDPDTTQEKMVSAGMARFDDVMANMDSATRARMEMYNPKAREMFELKVRERAADVSYNYALKSLEANMDNDIGRMIEESAPQGYQALNKDVEGYLNGLRKKLRPADYAVLDHKVRKESQLGLGEWYIANGQFEKAKSFFMNDAASGAIDEVTRARQVKALSNLSSSGSGSVGKGDNIINHLVGMSADGKQALDMTAAAGIAINLAKGLYEGAPLDKVVLPKELNGIAGTVALSNLPIVDGKTYGELLKMPATERNYLVKKLTDTVEYAKPVILAKTNEVANALEIAGLSAVEIDDNGKITEVTGDLNELMAAWDAAESNGTLSAMQQINSKKYDSLMKRWGSLITKERLRREDAVSTEGKRMDWLDNAWADKHESLVSMPMSSAEAKLNRGEKIDPAEFLAMTHMPAAFRHQVSLQGMKDAVLTLKERELDDLVDDGEMTQKQADYVLRYYKDIAEGKVQFMTCDPKVDVQTMNKCLEQSGLSPYDNTVPYSKKTEQELNDYSYLIRKAYMSRPNSDFTDYKLLDYAKQSGTIGWGIASVAGWLNHQANMTLAEAQALNFADKNGYPVVSDKQFSTAINNVVLRHAHELAEPADLTNSSVKQRVEHGWSIEEDAKRSAMGLPSRTSTDITNGYYFRFAVEIYEELQNQGVNIEVPNEALKRLAMFVRQGTPEFGKSVREGKINSGNISKIASQEKSESILKATRQTLNTKINDDEED